MSSALAKVSPLKPEIRLAQAISQFEADLPSDQKTSLRTYRSQIQNAPPDPSDVMRLTAEIDRGAAGRKASRRCFGPRMTNFLYAVQQFAAIGDIMIGGSQNLIACGVWSLVRMLLLSLVTMSSYLEKLSSLLMNAGRSAPRYQNIALLFPRSEKLQSYLAEYFIAVVGLCHTMFKFTHKSTIGQLASSLSDSELKKHQSDLDLWANLIKEEVGMLVAENIAKETQENDWFRALVSRGTKFMSREQKLKTRLRILDFCSTYDYETPWKQTRKIGNATLFNRTTNYQDWKGQAGSCTLLYTGKLGSGKSVLLANIVDDLNLYTQSKNTVVAYFFCRYNIPESLEVGTIIRSLVRQLLRHIPDLDKAAEFLDDTTLAPDFEHLFSLLQRVLPSTFRAYFILDGLDECDYKERNILIHQLRELQAAFPILVCISFRLEPDNALKLNLGEFTAPRIISMSEDNPDIEIFIMNELENCMISKDLMIGDPTLILEIRDALLQGSQGMFLWVALQIISLCAMNTDNDIRHALLDLPKDLSETFSRILARSEVAGQPYQRRILQLIAVAQRPLKVEEIQEALSVVPGNTTFDPKSLINGIPRTLAILACCGSLVIVDEEESTVRFVHHTVKTFLLNTSTSASFTTAEAHKTMTNIIATYLNYGIFDTQLSTRVAPQLMTGSVLSGVIHSTLNSSGNISSLALKLLRSKRAPDCDIRQTLAEARKLSNGPLVKEFHFHSYAKSYWQQHILCTLELEPVIKSLLIRLLESKAVDGSTTDEFSRNLLFQAVEQGNKAIVALLLEPGKFEIDLRDKDGPTLLSWAIRNKSIEVVKILLEKGVDLSAVTLNGQRPLDWASEYGHVEVVKILLENGVDPSTADSGGRRPLNQASHNGHVEIVKILLEKGADPSAATFDGLRSLDRASEHGHVEVVKILLEKGANPSTTDLWGWRPLDWALHNGHVEVVKVLLEKGADPSAADLNGQGPLDWASEHGHVEVVKILLEKGANPSTADLYGWRPLDWASENGHVEVVKILLEKGADPLSVAKDGLRALNRALDNGHSKVVELLQQYGA